MWPVYRRIQRSISSERSKDRGSRTNTKHVCRLSPATRFKCRQRLVVPDPRTEILKVSIIAETLDTAAESDPVMTLGRNFVSTACSVLASGVYQSLQ